MEEQASKLTRSTFGGGANGAYDLLLPAAKQLGRKMFRYDQAEDPATAKVVRSSFCFLKLSKSAHVGSSFYFST